MQRYLFPWVVAFVVAQTWAFVLLVPVFDSLTLPRNRLVMHWSGEDLLAHFLAMLFLGSAIFVAGRLLRRLSPRLHAGTCVTAALVALSLLAWNYLVRDPVSTAVKGAIISTPLAFLAGVGLAALSWRFRWSLDRWKNALVVISLIVSPVHLIFWFNAATYPAYESSSANSLEDLAAHPLPPRTRLPANIYIFIFDAWPHRLTFTDRGLERDFGHLRRLADEMYVFNHAHSPSQWTHVSIPRTLFGRSDRFVVDGEGRFRFVDGEQQVLDSVPSLFTRAREAGFRTYMVGWVLPYQTLLGSSVDYVRSVPLTHDDGRGFFGRIGSIYWNGASYLLAQEVIRQTPITTRGVMRNLNFVSDLDYLLEETHAILDQPHDSQFAVIHLPLPHFPFFYDREGIGRLQDVSEIDSVEQARDQALYLDTTIGRLVDRLRALGKYEDSTLVFTSDHTWRHDPELSRPLTLADATRVPFFLKTPRQTRGGVIEHEFSTVFLSDLIDYIADQDSSLIDVPEFVRTLPVEIDKEAEVTWEWPIEFEAER